MKNRFKQIIEETPEINKCYQNGLKALGKYSSKIQLGDTTKCEGSVDIDGCTTHKYPNDNRWDYVFGYRETVYFVEVHSADTSEVAVVLRKLQWLKDWLNQKALSLNNISKEFYWIQSNGNHIIPNSPQSRRLAQNGLKPISKLTIK